MQLFATCMPCQIELGHPSFEPFFVPYFEDRIAPIQCSRGHKSVVILQSQKFEVLLESGANALTAGFTLEASATFYAALERFFEFAAKVMLMHQGMSDTIYEQMFKELARQSERQIGSFIALHALVFGAAYVPNKEITPFRNAVIHKGEIPTPAEAGKFGQNIYSEIYRTSNLLRQHCHTAINPVISEDLRVRRGKIPTGTSVAVAAQMGLYSLAAADNWADFDDALEAYVKARDMMSRSAPEMQALHDTLFPQRSDI
jgi:hypothetical protein